jgi:histidine triad (HIT) family protein
MEDSVFTRIVKGELPSYKIYEDEQTLAFLDIRPVMPGMVVVIPKKQVPNVEDLDDQTYQALWSTVKKVTLKLRQAFPEAKKIAVQVEGLELDPEHAHVKLFPFNTSEEFKKSADPEPPSAEEMTAMAERLKINV